MGMDGNMQNNGNSARGFTSRGYNGSNYGNPQYSNGRGYSGGREYSSNSGYNQGRTANRQGQYGSRSPYNQQGRYQSGQNNQDNYQNRYLRYASGRGKQFDNTGYVDDRRDAFIKRDRQDVGTSGTQRIPNLYNTSSNMSNTQALYPVPVSQGARRTNNSNSVPQRTQRKPIAYLGTSYDGGKADMLVDDIAVDVGAKVVDIVDEQSRYKSNSYGAGRYNNQNTQRLNNIYNNQNTQRLNNTYNNQNTQRLNNIYNNQNTQRLNNTYNNQNTQRLNNTYYGGQNNGQYTNNFMNAVSRNNANGGSQVTRNTSYLPPVKATNTAAYTNQNTTYIPARAALPGTYTDVSGATGYIPAVSQDLYNTSYNMYQNTSTDLNNTQSIYVTQDASYAYSTMPDYQELQKNNTTSLKVSIAVILLTIVVVIAMLMLFPETVEGTFLEPFFK